MTNQLLAKLRIPGQTFRLPSHGIFYTAGELAPDVKNGEVEVYPMTAKDEIVLNTPDKLLSGKGLMEIFERCVPQVRQPGKLLAQDVDFLMVCLRYVSFGGQMEINATHTCDSAAPHEYTVDVMSLINKTKALDPTTVGSQRNVTLPNGQTVMLKPLTFEQVVALYQTMTLNGADTSNAQAETLIVESLINLIDSVDGISDRDNLREWVYQLPIAYKKAIEARVAEISNWGVDLDTTHTCKDCGQPFTVSVSLNPVSFFM